jgi:hypothetical protein
MTHFHAIGTISDPAKLGPYIDEEMKILADLEDAQRQLPSGAAGPQMGTSSTDDFLAWSTTRLPWQQLTSVADDQKEAAPFLNALNLV